MDIDWWTVESGIGGQWKVNMDGRHARIGYI